MAKRYGISLWNDENALDCGGVCPALKILKAIAL